MVNHKIINFSTTELDYVEEREGRLYGYEFNWKPKRRKASKAWLESYENASYEVIHREHFAEFVV